MWKEHEEGFQSSRESNTNLLWYSFTWQTRRLTLLPYCLRFAFHPSPHSIHTLPSFHTITSQTLPSHHTPSLIPTYTHTHPWASDTLHSLPASTSSSNTRVSPELITPRLPHLTRQTVQSSPDTEEQGHCIVIKWEILFRYFVASYQV